MRLGGKLWGTAALEVCKDWLRNGNCSRGTNCPYRHSNSDKVCKHWLRDLCKKGDQCEFLHEYNLRKMPECHFYTTFGAVSAAATAAGAHTAGYNWTRPRPVCRGIAATGHCNNGDECKYLHVDPEARRRPCPWYERGFCKNGACERCVRCVARGQAH